MKNLKEIRKWMRRLDGHEVDLGHPTLQEAESADKYRGWDPELIKMARQYDREEINLGIKHEQEHNQDPETDVVDDKNDLLKIVLAHMEEDPEYYTKLSKMEDEGYSPSEYPQTRDPYRQGGFSPYTHISHNGSIPRMARSKQKSVKRKPLSPGARSHLKEASFVKGKGATGKIELKRDQAPVGHGYSIDVNGAWGAFWPDAPRDAVVVEMVNIDDGTPYGEPFTEYDMEPKDAYEYVLGRIKRAGIRKFINAVRKAAGTQPNSPLKQSGSIRLRGLVKPSLKGPVRFVEYDFNRFDFKL